MNSLSNWENDFIVVLKLKFGNLVRVKKSSKAEHFYKCLKMIRKCVYYIQNENYFSDTSKLFWQNFNRTDYVVLWLIFFVTVNKLRAWRQTLGPSVCISPLANGLNMMKTDCRLLSCTANNAQLIRLFSLKLFKSLFAMPLSMK